MKMTGEIRALRLSHNLFRIEIIEDPCEDHYAEDDPFVEGNREEIEGLIRELQEALSVDY